MINLSNQRLKQLSRAYGISYHETLLLLSNILKQEYSKLFFAKSHQLSDKDYEKLKLNLSRRSKCEPIAKIVGEKEFYGFKFYTTQDTLDPRPETEILIELFKEYYQNTSQALKILDLGAGTGCIGITLLKLYSNASCCFVDISPKALDVARKNARLHEVDQKSQFIISDWFQSVHGDFDAIVSNPPYVETEYPLDKATSYDPAIALFAGTDGMDAYKDILPNVSKHLLPEGFLFIEKGFDQQIEKITPDLKLLCTKKDLSQINRACVFKRLR